MDSLQGQLLIASPHLPDPNFARSVVFMIEHNKEGALGLIVNMPTDTTLRELWTQVESTPCECLGSVMLGGPVQGPVMSLHGHRNFSETEVIPGVHIATQRENIRGVVLRNEAPFRIFSGYAGWGAGQLEHELEAGGWLTIPASAELIFTSEIHELWKQVVNLSGRSILRDVLKIDEFPDDPAPQLSPG